jgi:hyperosmotically inducible protein
MKTQLIAVTLGLAVVAGACGDSDAGITTSVKSSLVSDDLVKARNIDVDTQNRVVTLTGTVESGQEEARALELARKTEGVADVVDNISVTPPADRSPSASAGDAKTEPTSGVSIDPMITAAIKSKMAADPMVRALSIDVDTNDGVVTLTGNVSKAEKERAMEIARATEDVVRVEDKLTITAADPR